MRIEMPGACYDDAVAASGVPAEEGWPPPTQRRRGRGYQYVWDCIDVEERDLILSHVLDVYESRFRYEDAARDRAKLRPFLEAHGVLIDGHVQAQTEWKESRQQG